MPRAQHSVVLHVDSTLQKHIKRSKEFGKKRVDNKLFLRLFVGISGVMFLFGLAWLFATLSISVQVLREIAQILFTLTNSFQGLFIFLFLCVISSDARDEWKKVLMSMKPKPWFSLSPSSKETADTSIAMSNTMSYDTKEMTLNLSEVNIILDMAFGMNCNHKFCFTFYYYCAEAAKSYYTSELGSKEMIQMKIVMLLLYYRVHSHAALLVI